MATRESTGRDPTATIAQALRGLSYPCGRARVVEYARAHNVDPAALDVLKGIPDQTYASMAEVFKGVGLAPAQAPPPVGKPDTAARPPRPVQPQRREGRSLPTEEPEPATLEGQIEAGRPYATQLPPQPAEPARPPAEPERPRGDHPRRRGLVAVLRRRLGLD